MINKVFFRTDQDACAYEGENPRNWYGEDSYMLGEKVGGRNISSIGMFQCNESLTVVRIFVEKGGEEYLYCEIPMTSVSRIYYKIEDDTASK